jgi:chromosome segregation ATPase
MPKTDNSTLKRTISQLEKKNAELASKLEHALLDIKKVKLDAQEEQLKFKENLFDIKQKIKMRESEFIALQKNTPLSRSDYDKLIEEQKRLESELAELEKAIDQK